MRIVLSLLAIIAVSELALAKPKLDTSVDLSSLTTFTVVLQDVTGKDQTDKYGNTHQVNCFATNGNNQYFVVKTDKPDCAGNVVGATRVKSEPQDINTKFDREKGQKVAATKTYKGAVEIPALHWNGTKYYAVNDGGNFKVLAVQDCFKMNDTGAGEGGGARKALCVNENAPVASFREPPVPYSPPPAAQPRPLPQTRIVAQPDPDPGAISSDFPGYAVGKGQTDLDTSSHPAPTAVPTIVEEHHAPVSSCGPIAKTFPKAGVKAYCDSISGGCAKNILKKYCVATEGCSPNQCVAEIQKLEKEMEDAQKKVNDAYQAYLKAMNEFGAAERKVVTAKANDLGCVRYPPNEAADSAAYGKFRAAEHAVDSMVRCHVAEQPPAASGPSGGPKGRVPPPGGKGQNSARVDFGGDRSTASVGETLVEDPTTVNAPAPNDD